MLHGTARERRRASAARQRAAPGGGRPRRRQDLGLRALHLSSGAGHAAHRRPGRLGDPVPARLRLSAVLSGARLPAERPLGIPHGHRHQPRDVGVASLPAGRGHDRRDARPRKIGLRPRILRQVAPRLPRVPGGAGASRQPRLPALRRLAQELRASQHPAARLPPVGQDRRRRDAPERDLRHDRPGGRSPELDPGPGGHALVRHGRLPRPAHAPAAAPGLRPAARGAAPRRRLVAVPQRLDRGRWTRRSEGSWTRSGARRPRATRARWWSSSATTGRRATSSRATRSRASSSHPSSAPTARAPSTRAASTCR